MEINIVEILQSVLSFQTLLAVFIGTVSGIVIGGIPGLTATMAVALLIPITFSFSPLVGLCLMGGVYAGAMYGGSIVAILLSTPGTPAAAATAIEGYPLTMQGKGGLALKVSVVASFIGGTFSVLVLLLISPILAKFALKFGPPEYFLLAVMGLTGVVSVSSGGVNKGLISGLIGLIIALIGTDPMSGSLRYTFDILDLYEGVSFMPALIGMFSITQMLALTGEECITKNKIDYGAIKRDKMPKGMVKPIATGTIVGTIVGIIPGEGATIAAFMSYNIQKQRSKLKSLFGKGNVEGIAAAESGNNACVGGSLVPLLTLGIPGNTVSAALMGGLMIQGLIPGPELFTTHSTITYGFIISLFIANIVFLLVGLFFAPYFAKVSIIPSSILIAAISVFAIIGSYSMNNSLFDVWLTLMFAFGGYILKKAGFSLSAIILGLILGPIAENGFSQALTMSSGSYIIFFESIPAKVLWVIIIALTIQPLISNFKANKESKLIK
ncbi:tripartite tricarboxylate transport protein TctABC, permease subunit TctA [Campylobacter blaseri]|uniref:C4-dicarboxylate ABC transporter permease n=1 Tax=Campylobacter blaseri TaxID=2042961 RepID=A0A2P8R240_9BACT|nr:tripartite tricarboxylate transporter permease [Campylobacter blaseri]PSM52562.1 C4-dicarboxylate ABC transporter permease [Campylobacter blaseri]PSM54210.1 C4-dicarboxylate ABC transporter permease [Campylobacter blaseri]QKF85861.1 tripartite tricarboxylate transport protein TctABC, permease subunit TctA [Campylobacter blaseri]